MTTESPTQVPTNFRQFLNGLFQPSVMSVTTALACLGVLFVFAVVRVPNFMVSPQAGYLADDALDHPFFATVNMMQIPQSEDSRPLVAIVGASVTQSSFGSEEQIRQAVVDQSGVDVDVRIITSGRQSTLEHVSVIDHIVTDRPIHIVIGLGPSRFTRPKRSLRNVIHAGNLGYRFELMNEEAERLGLEPAYLTGIYAIDNRRFLLARANDLVINALRGAPREHDLDQYIGQRKTPEALAEHSKLVMSRFSGFEDHFDMHLDILERHLLRFKDRPNVSIYLVEHPINADFIDNYMGRAFYENYRERMQAWAAKMQLPYSSYADAVGLTASDFSDWAHISSKRARTGMRTLLAEQLKANLE